MSPALRKLQAKALGCPYEEPAQEPFQNREQPSFQIPENFFQKEPAEAKNPADDTLHMYLQKNWRAMPLAELKQINSKIPDLDINVHWHQWLSQVPKGL